MDELANILTDIKKLLEEIKANQYKKMCKECGHLNSGGSVFCGGCGGEIDG